MRLRIYPYSMASASAKVLAKKLNAFRIRKNSVIPSKYNYPVINWGNSEDPYWDHPIINQPKYVRVTKNKLKTYELLTENSVPTLEYTTSIDKAQEWLDNGSKVVERHVICGHGGKGARVVKPGEELSYCKLYTKYKIKKKEIRVIIVDNEIVDYSAKRRRLNWSEDPNFNKYIRSHDNGWVFCRKEFVLPDNVKNVALQAHKVSRLDFSVVDIGLNMKGAFVIEINSAPGLNSPTVADRVSNALRSLAKYY